MQPSQQQQQPNLRLSDITSKIPFTCRFLFLTALITWILDFYGSITSTILMNNNQSWHPSFKIWQLFTASFCINSLFTLMLISINFYTFLPKLQYKMSSMWLLTNYFILGAIIQTIYAILAQLLPGAITIHIYFGTMQGIWFNLIFKYCYYNSKTKLKLCCLPFKISKVVFPFVLLAILMLVNFHIKLDAIIGIALAFLECKIFDGNMIKWKNQLCCKGLRRFSSWIVLENDVLPIRPFKDWRERLQSLDGRSNQLAIVIKIILVIKKE